LPSFPIPVLQPPQRSVSFRLGLLLFSVGPSRALFLYDEDRLFCLAECPCHYSRRFAHPPASCTYKRNRSVPLLRVKSRFTLWAKVHDLAPRSNPTDSKGSDLLSPRVPPLRFLDPRWPSRDSIEEKCSVNYLAGRQQRGDEMCVLHARRRGQSRAPNDSIFSARCSTFIFPPRQQGSRSDLGYDTRQRVY
jgi:hypothetical protein